MRELDCSVILVHHTNKGGAVERGSVALRGAADVMIRLEDSDERVLVECAKTKDGKPFQSFHIRLHSVDTGLVDDELKPVSTPVAVLAHDDDVPDALLTKHQHTMLTQMALEIYADDGMTHSQIKDACPQMSVSTLSNALSSLKKRGYVQQTEKRGPYSITQAGRDALNGGKPWVAPAETPAPEVPAERPTKQARLGGMPQGKNEYFEAGL
jgi:DNA-binding HxlR family transcriptional regulator